MPLAKITSGSTLHCVMVPEHGSLEAICASATLLTPSAEQKHYPAAANSKRETPNRSVAGRELALLKKGGGPTTKGVR